VSGFIARLRSGDQGPQAVRATIVDYSSSLPVRNYRCELGARDPSFVGIHDGFSPA